MRSWLALVAVCLVGGCVTGGQLGECEDAEGCDDTDEDTATEGIVDRDSDGVPVEADCNDADPLVGLRSVLYADQDGDGFGNLATGAEICPAQGFVPDGTDCDDTDAAVNPAAREVCDDGDVDEDCDGDADNADDGASGVTPFFVDADGDGYGSTTLTTACDLAVGLSTNSSDCDDDDATAYPGGEDLPGDTVDQDCNGYDSWECDTEQPAEFVHAMPTINADGTVTFRFQANGKYNGMNIGGVRSSSSSSWSTSWSGDDDCCFEWTDTGWTGDTSAAWYFMLTLDSGGVDCWVWSPSGVLPSGYDSGICSDDVPTEPECTL